MPVLLLVLFFASGFAALVYEACWLELLAGRLSHSTLALSVVLAAYLSGLAIGARLAASATWLQRRPLLAYAVIEGGVALLAMVLPGLLSGLCALPLQFLGSGAAHAVRAGLCGAVLAMATVPLGATFPLQVQSMGRYFSHAARASGVVLGVQTLGGATGVALAGFLLLPRVGLRSSVWVAVTVTVGVAVLAWVASRRFEARSPEPDGVAAPEATSPRPSVSPTLVASIAGLIGGVSLALEVVDTRILGFFLPNLAYSFSAMLASYLVALAVGAGLAAWVGPRVRSGADLAVWAAVAGVVTIASIHTVPELHDLVYSFEQRQRGFLPGGFVRAALCASAALVFLPALCLSSFLPLAIGAVAGARTAAASAGRIYAANSIGAALGALLAATVLVPWFGLRGGVIVLGFACLVGAGLLGWQARSRSPLALGAVGLLALVGVVAAVTADPARAVLLDSKIFRSQSKVAQARTLIEHRAGSVAVAAVVERDGVRSLYTDAFLAAGTDQSYLYMKMLGHLPMLLVEEPRDAAVIMFGTGTTAGAVSRHRELERLALVEICPEVLELAHYFDEVNFGLPDRVPTGLDLEVFVDDGRSWLRRTREDWDVLTLEPLLPNSPAAVHFYTLDFLELARERLAGGGVLCHWIPLHGQPVDALESLLITFATAFDQGDLYVYENSAVLVGFEGGRPPLDWERMSERVSQPAVSADLRALGIESPSSVLGGYVCRCSRIREQLADAPLLTDDHPFILYPPIEPNIENFGYHADALDRLDELSEPGPPGLQALPSAVGLEVEVCRRLERDRRDAQRDSLLQELVQRREIEELARRGALEE